MGSQSAVTSRYQESVADYWDREKNPVNLRLGEVDGIYHHHYGIGDVDWSVLQAPADDREASIIAEMHRLETAQAEFLLDQLGPVSSEQRLLDAGSGRGGTSLMASLRFGCRVDGLSISGKQVDFANGRAEQMGLGGKVNYHLRNMLDNGFATARSRRSGTTSRRCTWTCRRCSPSTRGSLAPGGRYVTITGCFNDAYGLPSRSVSQINAHYICDIHPRSAYFSAMVANGLVPISVVDLTAATIPYWELRASSRT